MRQRIVSPLLVASYYFFTIIFLPISIRKVYIFRLNLRRNELTSESLSLLAEVVEFHDHITHLDVSWNKFYKTQGILLTSFFFVRKLQFVFF